MHFEIQLAVLSIGRFVCKMAICQNGCLSPFSTCQTLQGIGSKAFLRDSKVDQKYYVIPSYLLSKGGKLPNWANGHLQIELFSQSQNGHLRVILAITKWPKKIIQTVANWPNWPFRQNGVLDPQNGRLEGIQTGP